MQRSQVAARGIAGVIGRLVDASSGGEVPARASRRCGRVGLAFAHRVDLKPVEARGQYLVPVPGDAPEDGAGVDWLPFWFAHAANGAMVAATTAAA